RGLHHHRKAEPVQQGVEQDTSAELAEGRLRQNRTGGRRQPTTFDDRLGHWLVESLAAGRRTRADERQPEQGQDLLDRPVLALGTVQQRKQHVWAIAPQGGEQVGVGIALLHVDTDLAQRLGYSTT